MYFCLVTALKVFDLSLQIHSLPPSILLCVQGGWSWICLIGRGNITLGDSKKAEHRISRSQSWFLSYLVATSLYLQFLLKSLAPLGQSTLPLGSGYHSFLSSFQA